MQALKLADALFIPLQYGLKTATVRLGKRDIVPGPLRFTGADNPQLTAVVQVTRVSYTCAENLTQDDAWSDGISDSAALRASLLRFYPGMQASDLVTVIEFDAT